MAFRSVSAHLLIELSWNSADDFDLSLEEPDGTIIDYAFPRSVSGGALIDDRPSKDDLCRVDNSQEVILYPWGKRPMSGDYRVNVTHFENCGAGPTPFHLAILRDGVWMGGVDNGSSDGGVKQVVWTMNFRL